MQENKEEKKNQKHNLVIYVINESRFKGDGVNSALRKGICRIKGTLEFFVSLSVCCKTSLLKSTVKLVNQIIDN